MVYVVIPTRNRKELLKICLDSLLNQKYRELKIVVVDDGSSDGTDKMLDENYPNVMHIVGDGNLWWTGAMNEGVKVVMNECSSEDFILIQNDDTFMAPDYLKILLEQSIEEKRAILGTAVIDREKKTLIYNSHRYVKAGLRTVCIDSNEDLLNTDTLSGRGVLIPVEVFKKVGSFSKFLPQYGADYDFFCRARKSGFVLKVSTKAITYSTNVKPNLSKRIKQKERLSLRDVYDLFFSRRSSNNLWSSSLITLLHNPWGLKIYGLLKIFAYSLKILIVDWGFKGIKFLILSK